jgi:hypothetical protein
MTEPFWRELVKQDRLEEMYDVFRKRPEATDKEVAIRLARFAEAHIFNAADKRIVELEKCLPSDEVRNAIGYCWRWAQGYADKGGANTDERYAFMCSQVDLVFAWWQAMGGWVHNKTGISK